ncbi:YtxH domain-containing protein [Mycolicibacterium vinylchloridicum]|uniref:YtxH domain-containing protein n=1 Tax=Mycolicibacterium vinylchloridicum TaxID=2736928 RepID=UPI0015CA534A|nr:YtxH domain-containing protein [Mycolicibacterium vinylchloridicum]
MTKHRRTIAVFAFIGAIVGAALGYFLAPQPHWYQASANVALLPAPDLTTEQSSAFWEVLTRGQVSRTAAVLYNDARWVPSAANAAKVPQADLSLSAAALPDTTIVVVTVVAHSADAAEAGLNDVLNRATPEVASLAAPYAVKVMWPPQNNALPLPSPRRSQVAAAVALGGLLVGGGAGWIVARSRDRRNDPASGRTGPIREEVLPGL